MEDSGFGYTANEQRLLARFPCNTVRSRARRTASSKRLEPPRKTSNLSPKPVPKKVTIRLIATMNLCVFVVRWA